LPKALTDGQVGDAFAQEGLYVQVYDAHLGGAGSGAPLAVRYEPFTISASSPLVYNADDGGLAHDFILKENTTSGNFELYDNGQLVFLQAIAATTNIAIGAEPSTDSSLTLDFS